MILVVRLNYQFWPWARAEIENFAIQENAPRVNNSQYTLLIGRQESSAPYLRANHVATGEGICQRLKMDAIQPFKPTLSQVYGRGNFTKSVHRHQYRYRFLFFFFFFFRILECVINRSHAIPNFLVNVISTFAYVSFLCHSFLSIFRHLLSLG